MKQEGLEQQITKLSRASLGGQVCGRSVLIKLGRTIADVLEWKEKLENKEKHYILDYGEMDKNFDPTKDYHKPRTLCCCKNCIKLIMIDQFLKLLKGGK